MSYPTSDHWKGTGSPHGDKKKELRTSRILQGSNPLSRKKKIPICSGLFQVRRIFPKRGAGPQAFRFIG